MIIPADYPHLSHCYEFTAANYDAASKRFANLQSRFNRPAYQPLYDDGTAGDPVFSSASGLDGMVMNNNAFLSCRSMLLGEMTFFAVVEHTVTSGGQRIALMGAGSAAAAADDWAVFFLNGTPQHRQINGNAAGAASFGGESGLQLVSGVIDAPGRRMGVATNGEAMTYGPQISRPAYYAQANPELLIGDADWNSIASRFVGTIHALYAAPVNLLLRDPVQFDAIRARILDAIR